MKGSVFLKTFQYKLSSNSEITTSNSNQCIKNHDFATFSKKQLGYKQLV